MDDIEKSNRLREIGRETKKLEKEIGNYQKEMDSEIQRLRDKKTYAANNLAGATWEESISTEMSAVVASIKTKIDFIILFHRVLIAPPLILGFNV